MAKKKTRSLPVQAALGAAKNILCVLVLAAALSALVLGGIIPQEAIGTAAVAANALAVFLGSLITAAGCAQKRLTLVLASCGGYLALLLLGNLLLIGQMQGWLLIAAPSLGMALLAAVLASRKAKPKRHRL